MAQTVLILGASGNFGGACAKAFGEAGFTIRRYQRGTDMTEAAKGCDLIINALNPPLYHDWARQIPEITGNVLAAARASRARVIVPGNVYPYGIAPGPWGPGTPQRPNTRKGEIRRVMEARYRDSGLPVTLLRGGDFLQEGNPGTVMNMIVLKSLAKGKIASLGAPDVRRAYAYLPDMAAAAVALSRLDLPAYADIPFAGLRFSMADLKAELERQMGRTLRFSAFPWWFMTLASPFWELARELGEMRYLYDLDHAMDPAPLARLLPDFRVTPLAEVIHRHLA